jgi:hypothetical protein
LPDGVNYLDCKRTASLSHPSFKPLGSEWSPRAGRWKNIADFNQFFLAVFSANVALLGKKPFLRPFPLHPLLEQERRRRCPVTQSITI